MTRQSRSGRATVGGPKATPADESTNRAPSASNIHAAAVYGATISQEAKPMRTKVTIALAVGVFALSACSTASTGIAGDSLLAEHGLDGKSAQQIVDELDASATERPLAFSASVRENELLIGDGTSEVTLALPEDEFYVSVAPFVDTTHDCYYHSLATCQGELVGQDLAITITDSLGEVLVDEETTTRANGFVGYWLPRDVTGTIEVSYDDYEGSIPFSTTDGSPTCITSLRLEPAPAR